MNKIKKMVLSAVCVLTLGLMSFGVLAGASVTSSTQELDGERKIVTVIDTTNNRVSLEDMPLMKRSIGEEVEVEEFVRNNQVTYYNSADSFEREVRPSSIGGKFVYGSKRARNEKLVYSWYFNGYNAPIAIVRPSGESAVVRDEPAGYTAVAQTYTSFGNSVEYTAGI